MRVNNTMHVKHLAECLAHDIKCILIMVTEGPK